MKFLQDKYLASAFLASIFVHSVVLFKMPQFPFMPQRKALHKMEVTYYRINNPDISKVAVKEKIDQTKIKAHRANSGKKILSSSENKPFELKKEQASEDLLPLKQVPIIAKKMLPNNKISDSKSNPQNTDPEYLSYYESVRQAIRRCALNKYKWFDGDGEVYLCFLIKNDGALSDIKIESQTSTKNKNLLKLTKESIIEAAPFERFPKEFTQQTIAFSVVISFRSGKMEFSSRN